MTKELLPKWLASDLVVYATPIYYRFFNSAMKTFIDRLLPTGDSYAPVLQNGIVVPNDYHKLPLAAVLATCSFPQMSQFDILSAYVRNIFGEKELLVAEIYRHTSFLIKSEPDLLYRDKIKEVFEATVQGGYELIKFGKISSEVMLHITQPFDTFEGVMETLHLMGGFRKEKEFLAKYKQTPASYEEIKDELQEDVVVSHEIRPLNIENAPADSRWEMLVLHISSLIYETLKRDSSIPIEWDQGFSDLGMNDNHYMTFHKSLEKSLNCQFPITILFKYPTVKTLALYLAKEIFSDIEGFEHIQYPISQENSRQDNIDKDIEKLSETEAEDALIRELEKIL